MSNADEAAPIVQRVLVHDQRGALWSKVDALAASLGGPVEVVRSPDATTLGQLLTSEQFDVLIAGPGLDSRAGIDRLQIIRDELPRLVVVLAVDRPDHHEASAVVRAGAVDLIQATAGSDRIAGALSRALDLARRIVDPADRVEALPPPPVADSSDGHRVITVASASGGCGKTFLATNLAWFLTTHGQRRTCIIDLDLQFGEVSASLQLRPKYTITDLIQHGDEPASDLEAHIEEFCEQHDSGVYVLAAPRDPGEASLIKPQDVGRVIDAASRHFDDVIVDTPPALADTVVMAFNRSTELILMATLDVPSIRNLHVFVDTLERLDVPTDGVRLLINKAERDAGIEMRQVEELFPRGFDGRLPYAREVQRALNAGQPVMAHNPGAQISIELADATKRLLSPAARDQFELNRPTPRHAPRWRRGRHEEVVP